MKLLITEQQCLRLIEEYDSIEDYFEFLDETTREIFQKINNKEKIRFSKIKPTQFHTALNDYIKFGQLTRFPTKYVYRWKGIMVEGVAMLEVLTAIHGHSEHFPYDEFYDTFNYCETCQTDQYNLFTGELDDETSKGEYDVWAMNRFKETNNRDYLKENDWSIIYEFLDDYKNIDDYVPFFESGHAVMSDFGLRPLQELANELMSQDEPNEMLQTIYKMLEITHPRGDLAELFIEGGSDSLAQISLLDK